MSRTRKTPILGLECNWVMSEKIVPSSVVPDLYEVDNTPAQAKTIGITGLAQSRTMHTGQDVDWVKFTLTKPSTVTVQTSGGDTALIVASATAPNYPLVQNGDQSTASPIDLTSKVVYQLPAGTYHVRVTAERGDAFSYTLRVTAVTVSAVEAEKDTQYGAQPRSEASGKKTIVLYSGRDNNLPFVVPATGKYVVVMRYARGAGSWPSSQLTAFVDDAFAGTIQSLPSTNVPGEALGLGWNHFQNASFTTALDLTKGTHSLQVVSSLSGDGWPVEPDMYFVVPATVVPQPQKFTFEAENGTGAGTIMPRGPASNAKTRLVRHGDSFTFTIDVAVAGDYLLSSRYSRDSFAAGPTVKFAVAGQSVQYQAGNTNQGGPPGSAWAIFRTDAVGRLSLPAGRHTVTVSITGGDLYGIEVDQFLFDPLV